MAAHAVDEHATILERLHQRSHLGDIPRVNLRIAGVVVLALIAIVIAIAVVNELFITPDRPVATVGDRTIALEEWQQRVTYERAQRIIFLENQLEAFGGDVGIVQQFGGSVINELLDPEGLGENVLNVMAEELVICDAVAERGIAISDADVQDEINVNFGFFGDGVSPTGTPQPTQTIHCLLYTSDAADERSSVDLGGRRIIKKKKIYKNSSVDEYTRRHDRARTSVQ